jgi:N-acetylglucosamine malate deacetylase 1
MAERQRVFVVTAHPDDMEILCGGTVAKYRERGDEVTLCHACTGHLGHMEIPPEELVRIRWEEADAAARIAGIGHLTLGFGDLQVVETEEAVVKLAGMIREVRPTVIITHDPADYMPDHADLASIVLKASFVATLPQYDGVEGEYWALVPPLYYMDTIMGVGFQPEEYVDITGTFDTKLRMLDCHVSQVKWLKDHDGIDVLDNVETISRYRGLQCGVRYAEAFRRHRTWPRVTPERLLP